MEYDLNTVVSDIKEGKASMDVISGYREMENNLAVAMRVKLENIKRSRDAYQVKVDRSVEHRDDPAVTYYLEYEAMFHANIADWTRQVASLDAYIPTVETELATIMARLDLIDAEILNLRFPT